MIVLGTCAGHAFSVLNTLGIGCVEKVHKTHWHTDRAGACFGDGPGACYQRDEFALELSV
jgi:hypothetical protein